MLHSVDNESQSWATAPTPLLWQDTIEAFLRMPDAVKLLGDILRKVKDASRLLSRLQASHTPLSEAHAFALQLTKEAL